MPKTPDYIFPPRPKDYMAPGELPRRERTGVWVMQRKFNGTKSPIHITADRKVHFWTRHGTPHKQWKPNQKIVSEVLSLDLVPGLEYWLDGELLNAKTTDPRYKGKIVLYDIYFAGKYLYGSPDQMARLAMLAKICRNPTILEPGEEIALQVTENIWMAQTFTHNFMEEYKRFIYMDEIEGGVLRRKNSVIDFFGGTKYEVSWILRCRKPHSSGSYQC